MPSRCIPITAPLRPRSATHTACLVRSEKARQHYEQAIQINPFDPMPHQYLAELYLQSGDAEAAQREARVVKQLLGR